jgi:hypothetical protein
MDDRVSGQPFSKQAWNIANLVFLISAIFQAAMSPYGIAQAIPESIAQSAEFCAPLPAPDGEIIHVSSVNDLQAALNNLAPDTTILLADGVYNLSGAYIWIDQPGVALRSASGDREAVLIDGGYTTTEIVTVAASDVTIADLTLRRAGTHPIHVVSTDAGDTLNTLIYNVRIIDPRQQAIKINPHAAGIYFPDDGTIACSQIELTDAGRAQVSGCYTGGVDAHQARGWTIRDNRIGGFWCQSGLSEHAIHLWRGSRDTIVERNILRDNARGVGFGLATSTEARTYPDDPCPAADGGYVGHYDGLIRNNFVFASRSELFASEYGFDCGICLWQACGAQVLHNTVASTQAPFSSIEWRYDYTDVQVINNLVTHNLRDRGGVAYTAGNLEYQPLTVFVAGGDGDLHLAPMASAAIDQGQALAPGACNHDIDGDPRPIGDGYDIGADEYGEPALIYLPVIIRRR